MSRPAPSRGELYFVDLDPVVGREQAGERPFLVLSRNEMNRARLQMVIGLPLTTRERQNPLHVRIAPGTTGLSEVSYAMPEMLRATSTARFRRRVGRVSQETLEEAARNAGFLIGLGELRY
jgi:mRNA interferase MazF